MCEISQMEKTKPKYYSKNTKKIIKTTFFSHSWHLLPVGDRYLDHKIWGLLCGYQKIGILM